MLALTLGFLSLGGCYTEIVLDPRLDPVVHCEERGFWECRREFDAGRLDDAGLERCRDFIQCENATWPTGCSPVESDHERCIARLRDPAFFDRTTPQLRAEFDDCLLCVR